MSERWTVACPYCHAQLRGYGRERVMACPACLGAWSERLEAWYKRGQIGPRPLAREAFFACRYAA